MKNWKTSLTALVGAIAITLAQFHVIDISKDTQIAIVTTIVFVIGLLAKDANVDTEN